MLSPFKEDLVVSQEQLKEAQLGLYRVKGSVKRKKVLKFFVYLLWGYLTVAALLFSLLSLVLFSELYKKVQVQFIRHAWRCFFSGMGVTRYKTRNFPENPEIPKLIFTSRIHPLSGLFTFLLFKFPLIIPIRPLLKKFRLLPSLPSGFMSKKLKLISYPEESLANNLATIQKLLEKGYSVLVYVNQEYLNPKTMSEMPIHEEVITLLDSDIAKSIEIYFLRLDGIERLPFSTILSPIQIRCDLIKKEDLFYLLEPEDAIKRYKKIANYFGFIRYTIVK